MHESILKESLIHEDDQAVVQNPEHYGILHGDLNLSNFFYIPPSADVLPENTSTSTAGDTVFTSLHIDPSNTPIKEGSKLGSLSVFDWDQTQQGWFLWDVAQATLAVHMLHEAGSLIDGSVVTQAQPEQFDNWLVEGYELITGPGERSFVCVLCFVHTMFVIKK